MFLEVEGALEVAMEYQVCCHRRQRNIMERRLPVKRKACKGSYGCLIFYNKVFDGKEERVPVDRSAAMYGWRDKEFGTLARSMGRSGHYLEQLVSEATHEVDG